MKRYLSIFLATFFISLSISSAQDLPVIKTSADFDKLKQLIGDWEGTMKKPTGETINVTLSYKSTESVLDFELDPACGLKEGKHKFVKELKFTNNSKTKNVLKMEYLVINEDKTTESSKATYKRVK